MCLWVYACTVCMGVCVCAYVHVWMCMCAYVCVVCACVCVWICMGALCVWMYVCVSVHLWVCVCVWIMCMYMGVSVCMCIYVYECIACMGDGCVYVHVWVCVCGCTVSMGMCVLCVCVWVCVCVYVCGQGFVLSPGNFLTHVFLTDTDEGAGTELPFHRQEREQGEPETRPAPHSQPWTAPALRWCGDLRRGGGAPVTGPR